MTEEQQNSNDAEDEAAGESLTLWQVMSSALAAGFGVQSSKNRERDFTRGKPSQFIAIGILFTVLFVLVMVGIVNLVLSRVN
ncbi:MAG: DUF2970 domain-containing protein [Pseudomonadota bacterium]